jgi:hypothetical protein
MVNLGRDAGARSGLHLAGSQNRNGPTSGTKVGPVWFPQRILFPVPGFGPTRGTPQKPSSTCTVKSNAFLTNGDLHFEFGE